LGGRRPPGGSGLSAAGGCIGLELLSILTQTLIIETVGWIGAALILGAYILLSLGKVEGRSTTYQLMNVIGAAGFIVNGLANGAMPSAVLNIVWMGIGLYTLWRIRQP
jgi:hypothetical protein